MTEMPKDMTARLREVGKTCSGPFDKMPEWFKAQYSTPGTVPLSILLLEAADELEQMQQLAGRLLKRLAGD